jgi:glyoxylase-like metal-dependent hydrolase (beta-lactamase superfamily II)
MAADYSIRVLNYAHTDLPFEFCGGVPIHSGKGLATLAMHYTLISSRDEDGKVHHHLVDVGFDEPWIPRFGFYDYESPETVLAKVGVMPAEIETVLVSHMHFDHVNNMSRFPNAHVHVQWDEFRGWCEVLALPSRFTPLGPESWITSSFDRGDLAVFARLAGEGRLHFMADLDEPVEGVAGHLSVGGHTFGIQWFTVPTAAGEYVVASDTAMWYSNIEEMWPSGYTNGGTYQMLMTYGELQERVAGELDRVLPGHDMKIFERHPSWLAGPNHVAEVHVAEWDRSRRPQGEAAGAAGRDAPATA